MKLWGAYRQRLVGLDLPRSTDGDWSGRDDFALAHLVTTTSNLQHVGSRTSMDVASSDKSGWEIPQIPWQVAAEVVRSIASLVLLRFMRTEGRYFSRVAHASISVLKPA